MQYGSRALAAACVFAIIATLTSMCPNAAAQPGIIQTFPTQETTPQSPPLSTAPTLRVTSRETIVDVTVTDDKGNPVHGLKQKDFTPVSYTHLTLPTIYSV